MDNNRANQKNPNNSSYWGSRGFDGTPSEGDKSSYNDSHPTPLYGKPDIDNRANQKNPNNSAYDTSRGSSKK